MNRSSIAAVAAAVLGVWGIVGAEGLPSSAVMQFGNQGTGSPFPPQLGHDESIHAADKLVPRTVTLAAGGTVTFLLGNAVHAVGIYAAGTQPEDIDTSNIEFPAGCPPAPYLNDPTNRLASFAPICAGGSAANQFVFTQPGRYLVVCRFGPHLLDADMFGWVIVR